ncbi:hypothetical protein GQ44DRAFT_737198 [Phaeosphaeriaceae sp. PMI808]|nr:hypothetical protein GQ44DRAFT_737198 [Phaeosphaeriaceae sp. PMI808]
MTSTQATEIQKSNPPARFADLSSIARVWTSAFFDDEIIGEIMHPHRKKYPEDVYWFLLRGIRERFWDYRHRFIVVTLNDEFGQQDRIVGAAEWRRLGNGGKKMELWSLDPRNLLSPLLKMYHSITLAVFPNRAADPSRVSFLDNAVAKSEQYWTGHRTECYDLHVCGVHPSFQGKGVGRLLAGWGVIEAKKEEDDVVASVLCGEKNRGFYGKCGLEIQAEGSLGEGGGIALFTK